MGYQLEGPEVPLNREEERYQVGLLVEGLEVLVQPQEEQELPALEVEEVLGLAEVAVQAVSSQHHLQLSGMVLDLWERESAQLHGGRGRYLVDEEHHQDLAD